ncbi:NADH dehydrogenase [ubiquinone] 1 beta subcomplex subunit 6 [Pogona vitticeps]|uniref:NADH dehydrogenase [ubiquinone] 1 beta subcomplex subunit 6 n=1 Tax=Pogona vitticeps TaxID=103695 RepID=A0A6J0SE21_9SAUR|nr:NADH dehydrogenase [ubiquinone] 1 beta subcomplex subunit 6 [Pogona vitticeps]
MSSQESGLSPARQPGWLDKSKTDEELRAHQLRLLRRRWLKDQELSPREPVEPPRKLGPVERFWAGFLEPGSWWRRQVFKTYNTGVRIFVYVLVPTWVIHYYIKYHLMKRPHAVRYPLPKVYPGDVIQETGEVIPPLEIPSSHH